VQCGFGHADAILGGSVCLALGMLMKGAAAIRNHVNTSTALMKRCCGVVAALFGNVRQCGCNPNNNNNKPSCPAGAPEFTRTRVMLNVPITVVVGTSRMPVATLTVTAVCPVKCRSSK
jgi:hypothetical protein